MSNIKIEDDKLQQKSMEFDTIISLELVWTIQSVWDRLRGMTNEIESLIKAWCVRYSWKIEEISIGYQKFNLKENFDEKGVSFHRI